MKKDFNPSKKLIILKSMNTKQDPQLAWVHYPYIRNKKTKQEYSIDKDGPMGGRYIIYGDSLYISNHYNIYEEDSLRYTFTRYILR